MDISDNNLSFFRLLFDAPGVHGGWTCRKPILRSIIIRTDAKLKRNRGIQIVVYLIVNYRPLADAMLRIAGERIATPACGLVRNDNVIVWFPVDYSAKSHEKLSLRASAHTGVAIRFPGIRLDAIAPTER